MPSHHQKIRNRESYSWILLLPHIPPWKDYTFLTIPIPPLLSLKCFCHPHCPPKRQCKPRHHCLSAASLMPDCLTGVIVSHIFRCWMSLKNMPLLSQDYKRPRQHYTIMWDFLPLCIHQLFHLMPLSNLPHIPAQCRHSPPVSPSRLPS